MGKARRKEKEGADAGAPGSDSKLYLEKAVLERKLPELDMKTLVEMPAGLDYNEWLASHTVAVFNNVNLVFGAITEYCNATCCPDMTGPGQRMYLWFDEKGKKTKIAAPQYIDYVMTFIQNTVTDENVFPTKYGNEFPTSFEPIVRKMYRLMFHVLAHTYYAHFKEVWLVGLHAHLNLAFSHFTAFHRRYNLIEPKETEVLRDLEIALHLCDDFNHQPELTATLANISDLLESDSKDAGAKSHCSDDTSAEPKS